MRLLQGPLHLQHGLLMLLGEGREQGGDSPTVTSSTASPASASTSSIARSAAPATAAAAAPHTTSVVARERAACGFHREEPPSCLAEAPLAPMPRLLPRVDGGAGAAQCAVGVPQEPRRAAAGRCERTR